jgi:hypothetical protein
MKEFMAYIRGGWRKGDIQMSMPEFVELVQYAYAFRQLSDFLDSSPDWAMPTAMPEARKLCSHLKSMDLDEGAYDA